MTAVSLGRWLGNNGVLILILFVLGTAAAERIWPDLFDNDYRSGKKQIEESKLTQRRQVGLAIAGLGIFGFVLLLTLNPEVRCEFSGGVWQGSLGCTY